MKTYAYGFPRLGKNREFKKNTEDYWKEKITQNILFSELDKIQNENKTRYKSRVDYFPDGEMTLYDPMLDMAVLFGLYKPSSLHEYYNLCRGPNALEMTKWFNTNYHYLVTDFKTLPSSDFQLNLNHFSLRFRKSNFPSFIGPFTFLKLSKGIEPDQFRSLFLSLMSCYKQLFSNFKQVHIEEPAFVLDLSEEEINLISEGYQSLSGIKTWTSLVTYYESVDWIKKLLSFPVSEIGLDLIRGKENYDYILKNGFPEDKILIAGLVDGRNIWKNNLADSLGKLKNLSKTVKNLAVSNAAPLFHLPVSLEGENSMLWEVKRKLSFASEKLNEIHELARAFKGGEQPETKDSKGKNYKDTSVKKRISELKENDFTKSVSFQQRKKIHDSILKLPAFPTTTIGSFPQTDLVRKNRSAFNQGKISGQEYETYIFTQIDHLIEFQESLNLDVFVHGEFERTDMVEFFAQKLSGIETTTSGWIISYGTRTYRPPIIFSDVSRPSPMTLKEILYAQSKTKKPVKGMLTGAVTLIAWSFCREDIPVEEVAYQFSLCLKDEIMDYEKNGIKIVQVDEAAFREKAPIKKNKWPDYFYWAVRSFNLATNTLPSTQIHTHMCYSEFGEIIRYIDQMDFDVISIEVSRSKGDILSSFEDIDFKRQIGLGVWDIHSPSVPSVEKMMDIVRRSLQKISKENFWLNPDCGLKTRQWPEVKEALTNMMNTAKALR